MPPICPDDLPPKPALGCRRTRPLCSSRVSIFRSPPTRPSTKLESDNHARVAQFIRIPPVGHGAGHDHSSHAERSHRLGTVAVWAVVSPGAALEHAYHRLKDRLKRLLRAF